MYKIFGSDQQEYGPINEETLRQWIAEGRVNGETHIMAEGETEWKTLSSIAQFSSCFEAPPPAPAAGLKFSQEAQTPRTYAGYTPQAAYQAPMPVAKTHKMAISSLVLGIFGLFSCGITGLIGLILGIISVLKIGKSQGQLKGNGLAIAGICVSAITMLIGIPFSLGLYAPAILKAKMTAQGNICVSNVKQLGAAMQSYADEHKGQLPAADSWCDDIASKIPDPKIFKCSLLPSDERCNYGFNARLSKQNLKRINPQTVVLFEIDGGWNVSGGADNIAKIPRHLSCTVFLADGSTKMVPLMDAKQLRWEP
jgi:hypothetical protein